MTMSQDAMKKAVAEAALKYVEVGTVVGIGTGSTANFFIDALAEIKHKIEGTVASSVASTYFSAASATDFFMASCDIVILQVVIACEKSYPPCSVKS